MRRLTKIIFLPLICFALCSVSTISLAQPAKDVIVTNPDSQPVPVKGNVGISGTPNVNVTNNESDPITVRIVPPPVGDACGLHNPVIENVAFSPASGQVGIPVIGNVAVIDLDNATPCLLGQALTVRSEFVNMPAMSTAVLTPAVGLTPAFVPDVPGTYVIRVRASDDTGRSSFMDVAVVAAPAH